MTISNFDWFLHSMLFYHTQMVIQRQERGQKSKQKSGNDDSDSSSDNDI